MFHMRRNSSNELFRFFLLFLIPKLSFMLSNSFLSLSLSFTCKLQKKIFPNRSQLPFEVKRKNVWQFMQNKFSQVSTSYYMRFVCLFCLLVLLLSFAWRKKMQWKKNDDAEWWVMIQMNYKKNNHNRITSEQYKRQITRNMLVLSSLFVLLLPNGDKMCVISEIETVSQCEHRMCTMVIAGFDENQNKN